MLNKRAKFTKDRNLNPVAGESRSASPNLPRSVPQVEDMVRILTRKPALHFFLVGEFFAVRGRSGPNEISADM